MPSSRVYRLPLEVGGNEVDDLPHAVPSGGLRLCYRTVDHGRQRDGRVVAPEAGQDVLHHHPDQLATLGFELASKDRPQTLEPIRSRIQHWEGVSYRSWWLRHLDWAHSKWHQCRARFGRPVSDPLGLHALVLLVLPDRLLDRLLHPGVQSRPPLRPLLLLLERV